MLILSYGKPYEVLLKIPLNYIRNVNLHVRHNIGLFVIHNLQTAWPTRIAMVGWLVDWKFRLCRQAHRLQSVKVHIEFTQALLPTTTIKQEHL